MDQLIKLLHPVNIFILIIVLDVFIPSLRRKFKNKFFKSPASKNTPILLSHFTDNASLESTPGKIINGMHTQNFVVTREEGEMQAKLLVRVELPFMTKLHLLGVPRVDSAVNTAFFKGGHMEEVLLEGDYPNYFKLYADITSSSKLDTTLIQVLWSLQSTSAARITGKLLMTSFIFINYLNIRTIVRKC